MVRTGIFGGSFNPIHKGHLDLAREVVRRGLVDEMWLLVSPQNPLKRQHDLLPDDLRLRMARAAVRGRKNLHVSDFEFHLPRPSYMEHTLEELVRRYEDRTFSLLIGSDNWQCFPAWHHHEALIAQYPILIYPRPDYAVDASALPPTVTLLEGMPTFPVSSTHIREALKAGRDVSAWLPRPAARLLQQYIAAQGA